MFPSASRSTTDSNHLTPAIGMLTFFLRYPLFDAVEIKKVPIRSRDIRNSQE
jgi:hypothetical protein